MMQWSFPYVVMHNDPATKDSMQWRFQMLLRVYDEGVHMWYESFHFEFVNVTVNMIVQGHTTRHIKNR